MYKVNAPHSSFSCKGVEIPAHRVEVDHRFMLTEPSSDNIFRGTVQSVSMVFDYISHWGCNGYKYKEQESLRPDGGATMHLDDERDFCQPSRPYDSNFSWASFLLQLEMIWEHRALLRYSQDIRQQQQQWLVGLKHHSGPHHHLRNVLT